MVAAAFLASSAQASMAAEATFCERMATQLGMKAVERGRPGQVTGEWRVSAFTTMQRLLTGGSSMISFAMRPPGDVNKASVADYLRLQSVCQQQRKDILCRIEEPMVLTVSAGKGKAEMEALPGERAEVGTKGSHLFCRDPRAIKGA